MTEYGWISLLALAGWLILALGSYRAYQVGGRKTLVMVMAWTGIFLVVVGILSAAGT